MEISVEKTKLDIKNIFLTIIFMFLPIIDVYRTSGNNEQMMLSTHAIGFIIACILILQYNIRSFIKWFNMVWSILCIGGCFIINTVYSKLDSCLLYRRECWFIWINICLYGMFFINVLIQNRYKIKIKERMKEFICFQNIPLLFWILFILFASIGKEHIYRPICEILYFFPLFLMPLMKKEYDSLYHCFSNGVIFGFWMVQILAFLRRPWVDGMLRYQGMYSNSNLFDLMCLIILALISLRLTESRRRGSVINWKYWFWLLQYGAVFSLIVLSIGRFAMILAVVYSIIYILAVAVIDKLEIKRFVYSVISACLVVCIALPIAFSCAKYIPRILNRPILFEGEWYLLGDLSDDDNYVSTEEFVNVFAGRIATLIWDYGKIQEREPEEIQEIEENEEIEYVYEPGWEDKKYFMDYQNYNAWDLRFAIGLTYLTNLNWRGHTLSEWVLWVNPIEQYTHAHNVFIMLAYIYGIPSGLFFLLWIGSIMIKGICELCKNKDKIMPLFVVTVLCLVIGYGCVETIWQPGQLAWFLILFVTRMLLKPKERKEILNGEKYV